jgi:DNA-binding HxlR family transcriptional regulator
MPFREFEGQNCSIARSLAVVGERWTLLILREVLLGRRRYEEIRRNTGVATNILADRLETLVARGVLERRHARDSDAVEYAATEKGAALAPVLIALMQWGDRYEDPTGDGPPRVAVHTACDHDTRAVLTCSHCGDAIDPRELKMRPGPGADERQSREPLLPL